MRGFLQSGEHKFLFNYFSFSLIFSLNASQRKHDVCLKTYILSLNTALSQKTALLLSLFIIIHNFAPT